MNPIESGEKNFIEGSNLKAGLARAVTSNKPKLGQEQQTQVVKQTQIGSKWSHIVEYTHCENVAAKYILKMF